MLMYGIPNCDTVRKAKKFLYNQGVSFDFIDFRKDSIEEDKLLNIIEKCGWERILNKRSKTYRSLNDNEKQNMSIQILLQNLTLIKRPLLISKNNILVGFSENEYLEFINFN
jgi:arsenate reductase